MSIQVVSVVAGDFLAPSLLSCLDEGRGKRWREWRSAERFNHSFIHSSSSIHPLYSCLGMIDVLNACGVDYVCFGNHETDVPHKAMLERIAESNFVWVSPPTHLLTHPPTHPPTY